MKRTWLAVQALALALLGSLAPATAAEPRQFIPVPAWAPTPTMQLGLWLPCGETLADEHCIESLAVRAATETDWHALSFRPNPAFHVSKATQRWRVERAAEATDPEWVDVEPGEWVYPTGFTNSDGSQTVSPFLAVFPDNNVLVTLGDRREQWDLPADASWRLVLRSSSLPNTYSFVRSNAHDPKVWNVDANHVAIEVQAAKSYRVYGKTCDELLKDATVRASTERYRIELVLMAKPGETSKPGDLVLGTNGWWCFTSFGFNRASGLIEIGVGTAHLDTDGKPIEGWMEAKVSGRMAREWWGIDPTSAANVAKVSVTYEDGSTVLATTNARYDAEHDWIDLRSYGFHYSSPVLKVGFAGPKPAVVPAAPKKTITCVRGKVVKRVTAVAPRCPAGFKKR